MSGFSARSAHLPALLTQSVPVERFEVVTEDYLNPTGANREVLRQLRCLKPVSLHGVSLAIGSMDPLRLDYLARVRALVDEIQPERVSDHLSWGSFEGQHSHELLPLPFSEEALEHVVPRVVEVQERLGRQILLENVASYLAFTGAELTEWQFLSEVARRADCRILLDVSNVHVNARNLGVDPLRYIDEVDASRVAQFHLAGNDDRGTHLLDSHASAVCDEVWALYARAVARMGPLPVIVEWESNVPPLQVLIEQAQRAARAGLQGRTSIG